MFEFLIPLRRLAPPRPPGGPAHRTPPRAFLPSPTQPRGPRAGGEARATDEETAPRPDLGLGLAEEKIFDWEEQALQDIIDEMREQMNLHFQPGAYERGGNTKTHGLVHGDLHRAPRACPNTCARGCSPWSAAIPPTSATPVPARTCPRTSATSGSAR